MNDIYDKNMAAVKECYPEFADWIEKQPDHDWLRADGDQLHVTVGAVTQPMYAVDNPLAELKTFDTMDFFKETVSVFIGFGLGHIVNHVCTSMEKGHHVIIIDPVGHIYRLAFERYDFSAYIKSRTLIFAPGRAEVDAVIGWMEAVKVVADWQVFIDRTCALRNEYVKLIDYSVEILNQMQCNTGTVMSAGAKIADNDVATLPYVIRHRGVAELVNLFAGKPCVCVSTGPSLARNIHVLREWQDKVVIIAVGQALRPLLAADIRPDLICTVDFGSVNMTHYAGLCDSDIPLVTINKTYAPLLKAYRGPKFISAGAYSVETTHAVLKDMGELPQGGSVAHMMFGLAVNMGCSPVILVGQDLALGTTSHFAQADSMGAVEIVDGQIKWKVDDPRSTTLHARDDIGMGPAMYVAGWWDEPVLTNSGLATFITAMQRLVEQCPVEVINCTEGGCHLDGTHRMFLIDALKKHCTLDGTHSLDKSVLTPLLSEHPDADKRIAAAIPLIRKDIELLDSIIHNAEKALATVAKMRNTTSTKKLKALFADNYKYSEAANKEARRLPPVSTAIYWASRRIAARDLNVSQKVDHLLGDRKALMTRLERNEVILTACRDAARDLRKTYIECELLLGAVATDPHALDPTGETQAASIEDADHYLSIGNWAKPLLEARRIVADNQASIEDLALAADIIDRAYAMRRSQQQAEVERQANELAAGKNLIPQYLDLIADSRRQGRDANDMDAAIASIRAAIDLLPDREEARWGLASALLHLERFTEAAEAYAELVKRFPDKPRYEFEYGQALVLAGSAADGLAKIKSAMARSQEFDQFFGALARLYLSAGMLAEARQALRAHREHYPHDKEVDAIEAELGLLV